MQRYYYDFKVLFMAGLMMMAPVAAQAAADPMAVKFARQVVQVCPGAWDKPDCLTILSHSNYMMLANYGAALQENNQAAAAENLKQHCAAATAHREQAFPAYAMRSAFVECANTISDISDQTGLRPHQDLYQLLVLPVYCLDGHATCPMIEKSLQRYK